MTTAHLLVLASLSSGNHVPLNRTNHDELLAVAIEAHQIYANTLLAYEGTLQIDKLQVKGAPTPFQGLPTGRNYRLSNGLMDGFASVVVQTGRVGSGNSFSVSMYTEPEKSLSARLKQASTNSAWIRQAHANALEQLLEQLGPWNCDPILVDDQVRFEVNGVPLDARILLRGEHGNLEDVDVQWPPADYEPLSWPLVSHEKIMSAVRNTVTLDPATQSVQIVFRLGYPPIAQESLAKLTHKELDRRPSGIPFYSAFIYTKTRHGAARVEGFYFSAVTGELLFGHMPFLGSAESQSLLPGIYTLPNGWKATLSPAEPAQSTTWQPTTLRNPNGDTLKAETDPNLRFYKINGTTYLRSRIPG